MKIYSIAWIILLFMSNTITSQNLPAYQIFDAKGKKVTFKKMIKSLEKADIALFGEIHNDPIIHWLQLKSIKTLHETRALVIGMEMIERDNQQQLNEYLKGAMDEKQLAEKARLWGNYDTDYAPVINFAKKSTIKVIGTNVPRRYARQVFKQGLESLESLPDGEKVWIAPLPIAYDPNLPGYKNMLNLMEGHSGDNMPKAQAIKDATMAYSIANNFEKGQLFIHLNGAYHSDNYEGILWYLQKSLPDLVYKTITCVRQSDLSQLSPDNSGKADFIICVDEDMTNTY